MSKHGGQVWASSTMPVRHSRLPSAAAAPSTRRAEIGDHHLETIDRPRELRRSRRNLHFFLAGQLIARHLDLRRRHGHSWRRKTGGRLHPGLPPLFRDHLDRLKISVYPVEEEGCRRNEELPISGIGTAGAGAVSHCCAEVDAVLVLFWDLSEADMKRDRRAHSERQCRPVHFLDNFLALRILRVEQVQLDSRWRAHQGRRASLSKMEAPSVTTSAARTASRMSARPLRSTAVMLTQRQSMICSVLRARIKSGHGSVRPVSPWHFPAEPGKKRRHSARTGARNLG